MSYDRPTRTPTRIDPLMAVAGVFAALAFALIALGAYTIVESFGVVPTGLLGDGITGRFVGSVVFGLLAVAVAAAVAKFRRSTARP